MAKKVRKTLIKSPDDLVTSREQARARFIEMALEKNVLATKFVAEAKLLKALAMNAATARELLEIKDLFGGLLTASGLSDKALGYLTEDDKTAAVKGLIAEFLEPAGEGFVDELVYRYLLIKGGTLTGSANNFTGSLGERKLLRSLLSVFAFAQVDYQWKDKDSQVWLAKPDDDTEIENRIKSLYWKKNGKDRLLVMNIKVPLVGKNVDIVVFEGIPSELKTGKQSIIHSPNKYLALGELKSGIDPAAADERWKTAQSAVGKIRVKFEDEGFTPKTLFIAAAIEKAMAIELFNQLKEGTLTRAANLTRDDQLASISEWVMNL